MKQKKNKGDVELGARIRYVRKLNDLTQEEFAERMFVSQDLVSLMERGLTPLMDQNRKFICHNFGVSENWLLTGEGDIYESITKNIGIKDKDIERLISKIIRLNPTGIEFVEDIVDTLLNKNVTE